MPPIVGGLPGLDAHPLCDTLASVRAMRRAIIAERHSLVRRVLLADDHPLFREALSTTLRRSWRDIVVDEVDCLRDAIAALDEAAVTYELVLLDLKLPDCDGFGGLLSLRSAHPETAVAIVSARGFGHDQRRYRLWGRRVHPQVGDGQPAAGRPGGHPGWGRLDPR